MGYNSKKKFYINDDEEEYKLQSHSREKKKGNDNAYKTFDIRH